MAELVPPLHDLRAFFRSVGNARFDRAHLTSPLERPEVDEPVELLDGGPVEISADPIGVAAFVDGIQASLCVSYRGHRPVYLNYAAAGGVSTAGRPVAHREHLAVVCSPVDREWVDSLETTIPVEELTSVAPPELEREGYQLLGVTRAALERSLIDDLCEQDAGTVCIDGALVGRRQDLNLVAVAKTLRTKYLPDEKVLYGLAAGWRSPRFRIPAGVAGGAADRFSCYLRLFPAHNAGWSFGLIRLESFDPEVLDALAARALSERQGASSGDARWDRHLKSVRVVEEFLRQRRPAVFTG